jgi:alpha-glucosidase
VSRRLDDKSLIARAAVGANGGGSPWRVIMLGDELGNLIESNLIGNLNPPAAFDTSWIKPGKTAWDWWSGPYLPPPDKGGTDMPTKVCRLRVERSRHDDRRGLVSEFGHGGRAPNARISRRRRRTSTRKRSSPAKKRCACGCGCVVAPRSADMDAALAQYEKWGIAGIKVDFMDRNDQQMIDYYHKLMAKAAGQSCSSTCTAPIRRGSQSHLAQLLTQEGIMGAEYNNGAASPPRPTWAGYTRMLLGPMDYTGRFRNRTPAEFEVNSPPQGRPRGPAGSDVRRESPFQMVADSPMSMKTPRGSIS